MRIASVRIQNFRSFRDETINFGPYSCLVGPNGAGKSAVLCALNILFRNSTNPTNVQLLSEEDFHNRNTSEPVVITVTFDSLSDAAKADLQAYVRHDRLVVTAKAVWDADRQAAEVKQYGERLVMPAFAPFFEAEAQGAKVAELKQIYGSILDAYPDLPTSGTKAQMIEALRTYEEEHPSLCDLIPSEDQFYGWSKGENRLAKHCQWVYVPAVKDASEEQDEGRNTALGQLLQRTIRSKVSFEEPLGDLRRDVEERYQAILEHNQSLLEGLSGALQSRLHEWAHPGTSVALRWHYDPAKSVAVNEPIVRAAIGEGSFRGELARLGHGLQRSFLVALLQELSSSEDGTGPTLILGIEEPELYQHPPQARHLAGVLERLARHDAQVVVTTHSPYFVSARGFECVRMVQKVPSTGASRVSQYTFAELSEAIALALQAKPQPPTALMAAVEQILQPSQVELFFTSTPVLVEGPEDVAFIATYLHLMDKWDDFRKLGCHFVVCNGKTNMSRPLGIAIGLRVPAFVVFDGDLDDKKNADRHMRDNMCLLRLCGHTEYDTADGKDIWWQNGVMWHTKIAKGVLADLGKESWEAAEATAKAMEGLTDGVGRKNALLIAATLEILWDDGKKSDRLTNLCSSLLAYARNPWKDVPHEMSPVVLT